MSSSTWTWTFDARIPSIAPEGKKVVDQLLEQLNWHEWQEHDVFGIHLAIEEAVVNAIKHGNQDDPSKFVHVVINLNRDEVQIQVTDDGDGFVPSEVPDPTDDENIDLPSGRGLMLMRSFMTLVEYNAKGNSVRMEKRRTTE